MISKKRIVLFIGATILSISLLFHNCATIIESTCPLSFFEGTYVGSYVVSGAIYPPDIDTVDIQIDTLTNSATMTSVLLDTTLVLKYASGKNQLLFTPNTQIPYIEFVFEEDLYSFTNVIIKEGYVSLDPSCDRLVISMDNVFVEKTNIPLFGDAPIPKATLKSITGEHLIRIR